MSNGRRLGRPPKPLEDKCVQFHLTLPGRDYRRILEAAQRQGTTLSALVRKAALSYLYDIEQMGEEG